MHNLWRFDPTTLRLFISACDEGTFGRAAEKEGLVPSALSKRIAELEEVVGAPLLYRLQKGIQPTPAGLCLLQHAKHVLGEITAMSAALSHYADGEQGHLRISSNRSSIVQFLPQDIRAYREAHAGIQLELHERTSEELIDDVSGNVSDVGIGTELINAEERGLTITEYRSDQLVVVVPHGHSLSERCSVAFSETLPFNHVALHKDSPLYRRLDQAARLAKQKIKYEVHVKSFDAVCRMVEAELGLGIIPRESISYIPGVELVAIPLADEWAIRRFQIVTKPQAAQSKVCSIFVEFLRARAAGPLKQAE
ncbi:MULTISPECIES: LysR substrate-binding domain-containing protein [unclassified Pseudomonas]|uniref:LysR substrate-binding domain-containing protein n=1 Tax=unclassified Pseudomonas TaxID=196821 RepID=UPI0025D328B4|nr:MULTISPECIES: LysR substrate-binding domain-containing protein [unclassified Pseudomonas]